MHTQHDLFRPACGRSHHRQARLFDPNGVEAGDCGIACEACGAFLVRTDSHLCCPNGHGKLVEMASAAAPADDDDTERGSGLWFEDELPTAPEPPPASATTTLGPTWTRSAATWREPAEAAPTTRTIF